MNTNASPYGQQTRGPAPLGSTSTADGVMAEDRVRVVIAEDSVLLRDGIARLLEQAGFEVVGQAGDGEDLLRKVGAHKPDVAVIDVRMPPTHTDEGLRAARRIRAEHPDTAVLVLSQYVEEAYALDLLSESTERTGYLLKDRIARRGELHRRRPARRPRRLRAGPGGRGVCCSGAAAARTRSPRSRPANERSSA